MGRYLQPGHQFTDGQTVTGPSLTEHVSEAIFKTTSITEQTLKTPAALTDQLLVVASGAFFQETIQQIHDLILYPGCVVQTVYAEYTANTNLTTVIPPDDTIPQNTEGTEVISLSITPRFATSKILLRTRGVGAIDILGYHYVGALFRDSATDAIAAEFSNTSSGGIDTFSIECYDSPNTVSLVTYKLRVGPQSGATILRMNGHLATRYFGGVSRTTLVAQEIKA